MENKVLRTKSEIISSLDGGNSLRCTKHIIRQNWLVNKAEWINSNQY